MFLSKLRGKRSLSLQQEICTVALVTACSDLYGLGVTVGYSKSTSILDTEDTSNHGCRNNHPTEQTA